MANRDSKLIERVLKDFSLGAMSGTKVVTELPQVGEEHIIYELQEKKIIPSLIPMINQQMIDDKLVIEIALSTFVFNTYDDMVNTITPLIPNNEIPDRVNYVIKEDKLIMSIYGGTDWQFIEAPKVSDYKFDLSSALGSKEPAYVVMLKEYLGKTSEESGDIRYTGKLLNDKLYTFGANTFCIVLGAPTSGIMTNNVCEEGAEIPEDTPKELIFEYIPYEKIIKENIMQWVFKPKGIGEVTVSSYWIYTNESWFNADEIREFKSQEKTVSPSTSNQQITPDKGYDGLSKVTVEAIELQNKEISPSTSSQSVIPDKGYDGLREVTVNAIALQDKTVTPAAVRQEITYDSNYNGLGKVTVEAVDPVELQDKTVTPTTEIQNVTADADYSGLGTVTVSAVTSAIDSNIKAENIKKGVAILGVTGTHEGSSTVILQEKSVSPTTTTKEVTADSGFDGLSKVTVEAVKLQSKTTSPTLVSQEITPDEGFNGLGAVTIEAVNLQDKTTSPTTSIQEITSDEGYVGLGKVTVGAVALQDKVVKPTTSVQEITPDDGYLGLGKVTVEASEAAETAYYQFIFNNHEDISSKRFNIDWSKLPDFFQETFGISPDLTFSEIAAQVGTSDYAIRFPLAVGDTNTNNKLYFNSEIYFVLEINNNNAYFKRDGYLNGFLNFEVNPPYSSTLREAISLLPTTTTGTSSGVYALLILGVITLTEITE